MNGVSEVAAPTLWQRRGAALGIVAASSWRRRSCSRPNSPGGTGSDADIASWYASDSHQHAQMFGFVGFALGVLCLIGFLAVVRERIAAAEREPGSMGQLAFGAGIASAVLFVPAIALFTVPAFMASDTSAADVVPATYRMFNTAAYASWVAATMISAITVAATTAVAFRTGFLPRWFAWLGALVAVVLLLGFFFVPGFVFWGWILISAVLLLARTPAKSASRSGRLSVTKRKELRHAPAPRTVVATRHRTPAARRRLGFHRHPEARLRGQGRASA